MATTLARIKTVALLSAGTLLAAAACPAASPTPPSADRDFFAKQVQPILAANCYKCHSHEAGKIKGGLVVDSVAGILKGGDTGSAVVPGEPEKSLLIKAVRQGDPDLQMPPKGEKLSAAQIAVLEQWVKLGAPAPVGEKPAFVRGKITDEDRKWWAFQPVGKPAVPTVKDNGWARTELDRFIFARLQAEGLKPSPEAERATLVRRVYFDLIGLPPTPGEVDGFLADKSANAYEKLVDQLLNSPRHGEKWARHWLDLVRYAESDGYKADDYRPHAWRYRDYVIKSFNEDKPYDRFVREQLAGDELYPDNPEAIAGTSYLRHGIYEYNNRDVRGQWTHILNDLTDTTADAFLGMGLQCARCHDHKFDPLLQKDYYRLQAFFAPILPRHDLVLATPQERAAYQAKLAKWEEATAELRAELEKLLAPVRQRTEKSAVEKFIQDIQEVLQKPVAERTPYEHQIAELAYRQVVYEFDKLDAKLKGDAKERVIALRKKLTEFDQLKPEPLTPAFAATDVGPVAPPTFLPKGRNQDPIAPGFLTVLAEQPATVKPLPNSTGRRSELARWLTEPENPLTARVMVNRVWQWHFGRGLAANTSDFGKLGEKPSHPELLDWLAARFVTEGWSLKQLHRLIVTSATYRQGAGGSVQYSVFSKDPDQSAKIRAGTNTEYFSRATRTDPENKLLWRFPTRRLEAEQIRDAMLAVTGELKLNGGGPGTDFLTPRRTIYTKALRNARDPLLDVFDLSESFNSVPQRNVTTTPTQALLLFNSQMMLRHAKAFAKRLEEEHPSSDQEMVTAAYRLAFSREPRVAERTTALKFLQDQTKRGATTTAVTVATTIATEKMPYRDGVAAVVSPEMGGESLAVLDSATLPTGDFTIEACILLRTVEDSAAVRTIAAKWDGSMKNPGWGFAVTGKGSRRKPQTLVMQIIGQKQDGSFGEEAIFSDQQLVLGKPYFIAASVKLATAQQPGEITFYVRDLANDDEPMQVATVPHKITGGFQNQLTFNLGGRAAKGGGFDGMLDDVRLSAGALAKEKLLLTGEAVTDKTAGLWRFEATPSAFKDSSPHGNDIRPGTKAAPAKTAASARAAALADFCHVLLNANEFVYVD